jgi:hypothetical protein
MESQKQKEESQKPRAKSGEDESQKPKAERRKPRAKSEEPKK